MAEEEVAEEEKIEDQEETEDQKETSEKDSANRSQIKKILGLIGKIAGLIFVLFVVVPITTYFVLTKNEEKAYREGKKLQDEYLFSFPKLKKRSPRASLGLGDPNISRPTKMKIKLDDLKTIILTEVFLSYDEENSDLGEELERRKLEIIDRIQFIIASKNYYDINTADKREYNLKKELVNEINSLLDEGKIENLYFTQFYVTRIRGI